MRGGANLPKWLTASSLFTEGSAVMYVVVGLMGATNGLLAAVGYFLDVSILNLHAAGWLVLLGWAGTTAYLSYKRVSSGGLAVGLYFLGLFVLLQPIAIYGPLLTADATSGMTRAQLLIDSWQGIIWWGAFGGVLALAILFTSRLLTRDARQNITRRTRQNGLHETDD